MRKDPAARLRNNATEIASLLVTGLWLAVLLVGYIVVVPIVALLFGDETDIEEWWDEDERERLHLDDEGETASSANGTNARDALETLRERYAAGELTDEQFERKLERLLETDTLENVEEWRRTSREERERRDWDLEYEIE